MYENLNSKVFRDCLNTTFHLHISGANPVAVELVDVTEKDFSPRTEQFSLIFRGPSALYLAQGIYHIEHDTLGAFDLFLVPVGPDDAGLCYESVFNRLRRQ